MKLSSNLPDHVQDEVENDDPIPEEQQPIPVASTAAYEIYGRDFGLKIPVYAIESPEAFVRLALDAYRAFLLMGQQPVKPNESRDVS